MAFKRCTKDEQIQNIGNIWAAVTSPSRHTRVLPPPCGPVVLWLLLAAVCCCFLRFACWKLLLICSSCCVQSMCGVYTVSRYHVHRHYLAHALALCISAVCTQYVYSLRTQYVYGSYIKQLTYGLCVSLHHVLSVYVCAHCKSTSILWHVCMRHVSDVLVHSMQNAQHACAQTTPTRTTKEQNFKTRIVALYSPITWWRDVHGRSPPGGDGSPCIGSRA